MAKIVIIEGTIQPHGKNHTHIYIHGETGKKLSKYVGKKVKGIIIVIENENDSI